MNSVLCGFRGSIAHNTYVPSDDPNSIDDVDIICVYTAIPEHYIGLGRNKDYGKGKQIQIDEFDCVHYELKHFINLLLKSNPTTTLLLWLDNRHYLKITEVGQKLIDNRRLFSSKKFYRAFTEYAKDQLRKMKTNTYEGYMGVKRKALVDKFGYDCKNAAHSIRLLRMAKEFMVTGELKIFRDEDADDIVQIKTGQRTFEDVKALAKEEVGKAEEAYKRSKLPEEPAYDAIEKILMEITKGVI